MAERFVVFAKAPVPGEVKTRLIPALGAEGAAELAKDMLSDTLREAAAAGAMELCVTPAASHGDWRGSLPEAAFVTDQGEGDLGERLARAAERVLSEGDWPVLIGTDCPDLDRRRLHAAAAKLQSHDAVLQPALDGGYVLLGLRRFNPSLFTDIAWSTGSVAEETIGRIAALGWSLHLAEPLRDIDRPEDLHPFAASG